MAVFIAMNSEPNVDVSTVFWRFEYHMTGVLFANSLLVRLQVTPGLQFRHLRCLFITVREGAHFSDPLGPLVVKKGLSPNTILESNLELEIIINGLWHRCAT